MIALVSLVASSAGTGLAAHLAPAGHAIHITVVAVAYIGIYGVLWLAKFALYQGILFRPAPPPTDGPSPLAQAHSLTELGDDTGH